MNYESSEVRELKARVSIARTDCDGVISLWNSNFLYVEHSISHTHRIPTIEDERGAFIKFDLIVLVPDIVEGLHRIQVIPTQTVFIVGLGCETYTEVLVGPKSVLSDSEFAYETLHEGWNMTVGHSGMQVTSLFRRDRLDGSYNYARATIQFRIIEKGIKES